ncbi:hypothetical protein BC829DRAFT_421924 [Chytridium lagenaria]|nr:hypothetical protein BC829DRAFT_421924 [Chytridium lagenaria]
MTLHTSAIKSYLFKRELFIKVKTNSYLCKLMSRFAPSSAHQTWKLVSAKAVRKQLQESTPEDLTPLKADLNQIIQVIYNEVAASKTSTHVKTEVKVEPTPPETSTQNGHAASTATTPSSKRKSTMPTPSSRSKKVKSEEIVTDGDEDDMDVAEDDESFARRLQEQENSRGSRRVATRGSKTPKKPAKKRKSSDASKKSSGGGFNKPVSRRINHVATCYREQLWVYIKEKGLQNEKNRKEILCDDALKAVFKVTKMGIFEMNKLLTQHVMKADDVVGGGGMDDEVDDNDEEEEEDENTDDNDDDDDEDAVKSKAKPKKAKKPTKTAKSTKSSSSSAASTGAKKTGGFHTPMVLSDSPLRALNGEKRLSRTEVVKRLWVYIKANSLQDPNDGRNILFDDALKSRVQASKDHQFPNQQTPHRAFKESRGCDT